MQGLGSGIDKNIQTWRRQPLQVCHSVCFRHPSGSSSLLSISTFSNSNTAHIVKHSLSPGIQELPGICHTSWGSEAQLLL